MLKHPPIFNYLEIDNVIFMDLMDLISPGQKIRDELRAPQQGCWLLWNLYVGQWETLQVRAGSNVWLEASRSLPIGCCTNIRH